MKLLDTLLAKPAPQELFHYTSQDGVLGIVKSKALWASKITYLNDTTELALALDLAIDAIQTIVDGVPRLREELLTDLAHISETGSVNIFVCSLSSHGDQLGQWRGYSPAGQGYAVGFDPALLRNVAAAAQFTLGPCTYDPDEHLGIVRELVQEALDLAASLPSGTERRSERSTVIRRLRERLFFAAPFLKHQSFSEESEWRLVSAPTDFRHPNFRHRAGKSHLIPYYQLDLASPATDHLPISGIIVGPTAQPRLARDAIESLILSSHITSFSLRSSQIPFRSW